MLFLFTISAAALAASGAIGDTTTPIPQSPWEWVIGGGAGLTGALTLFLYGFRAEWWVTGAIYRRRVDEFHAEQVARDRDRTDFEQTLERVRSLFLGQLDAEREASAAERERVSTLLERVTAATTEAAVTQREVVNLLQRLQPPTAPPGWRPPDGT